MEEKTHSHKNKDKEKDIRKLEKSIQRLKKESQEYLDGWKRAKADYKNLQAQIAKEKIALEKYATERLLLEILPIVDYFKYAFKQVPDDQKNSQWMKGMNHIYDQYMKVLKAHGVEQIKTVGEVFDPERHDAIEDVDAEGESGIIAEEVATGFTLNNKVIQPAKVKVIK